MTKPTEGPSDAARLLAFRTLRRVTAEGAYANLALGEGLATAGLSQRDAGLVTELVNGTCRGLGLYDVIIAKAAGRPLTSLQPAVIDALRLGCHQLLELRVPTHAAVATTVELGRRAISPRVTGVINAILRKVAARALPDWLELIGAEGDPELAVALALRHPEWIIRAYQRVLPAQWADALAANNVPPVTHLAVRPGLAEVTELSGQPTPFSPYGAIAVGDPGRIPAIAQGRAGVQDEGSQLVALALARAEGPSGPWLDTCAGPGGKAALLAGLARQQGHRFLAAELRPHRAALVAQALRAYPEPRPFVITADGTRPPWPTDRFAKVMVDAPCTGLGALRRRPEARWRKKASALTELVGLQRQLLANALAATIPGGVVAYVTCSPVVEETDEVVESVLADGAATAVPAAPLLPEVPEAERGDFVQLWPHRHGTDAMFLALLRRR